MNGLNHLLQDSLSRHSSPALRRRFAHSFTLVLVRRPVAGSAGSSAGSSHDPQQHAHSEADLVALESPQSLGCLEQLHVVLEVGWPLSVVVGHEALQAYNRLWTLLLQIRRAEMALNDCALPSASAAPHSKHNRRAYMSALGASGGGGHRLPPTAGAPLTSSVKYFANLGVVQHAFYLLKAELQHFLRSILDYMLSRATSAAWTTLLRTLARHAQGQGQPHGTTPPPDTQHIKKIHQNYLDQIMFQCLLTPKVRALTNKTKNERRRVDVLLLALSLSLEFSSLCFCLCFGSVLFVFCPLPLPLPPPSTRS